MIDRFNLLSQQLLQKEIPDCSVEELQQLSQQYPFFAPVQLMLLKKFKEENSPEYAQQLQKAALYYHSPLAFDFLINDQEYNTTFPSELIHPSIEKQETEETAKFDEQTEEISENTVIEPGTMVQDTEQVNIGLPASQPQELEIPTIETSGFDIMDAREAKGQAPDKGTEQIQKSPTKDVPDQSTEEAARLEPVKKELHLQNQKNVALTFEPFHTVDYFASVGIKLSQEEVSKDNFGRQLKSFTEWLKTMKRLPAAEQLNKLDPRAEEKVENIAAHSLDNSEILTEAMAEVWVKQGKLEKAIEVYNKLSLINPSKKAYFAAKLENLKKAI